MKECTKLKTYTEDGITILVNKEQEDIVIATKKALLERCESKCEESETCNTVLKFYKLLTQ